MLRDNYFFSKNIAPPQNIHNMLTPFVQEKGKEKCSRYFPLDSDSKPMQFDKVWHPLLCGSKYNSIIINFVPNERSTSWQSPDVIVVM